MPIKNNSTQIFVGLPPSHEKNSDDFDRKNQSTYFSVNAFYKNLMYWYPAEVWSQNVNKISNWQPHPYGQEVNPTKFEHNSFNCHVCCYSVNTIFFGPNFVQPRFFFFSKEPCYICRLMILWDGIQPETSRVRWLVMCSRIEIKKLRLFFSGVLFAPGKTMPLKCTILWDI
jgi:hypothetical protein